MNLAIFDVDGTLTGTDHIDNVCFLQTLADAHAITDVNTDWAAYPHTTDSAILSHIFGEHLKRAPEANELQEFRTHFVGLLADYRVNDSSLFAEIDGAYLMLRRLNQEPEWRIAIASGGWRVSAALKLKVAGIEVEDFPGAFADDGLSREEILQTAVLRAQQFYQQRHFHRIVSVGDGVWDVRTARNLKFPFLGVGSGDDERRLRDAGAKDVVANFADYEQVISCLLAVDIPSAERTM